MITATQGVQITSPCPTCGDVLVRDVGQYIERGQLRWGVEGCCGSCATGWCERGAGPAPEEVRQALLAQHGAARLRLASNGSSLVPVLRALREVRRLSLGEARLTAAELSEIGLVGTGVEVELLAEGLCKQSVPTTLTTSPA
ncbi:hypothetical protein [Streptomyces sp. NPDC047014]|uniref:hypothetical protein n=1 Tax=Streptomyces sp. NPDC047014 TaxID=3155736 RepID=UPI0033F6ACC3